ncbi:peptidylprolyl isomerase [Bremerella sp. JC770]|uniref:peptidylprolyl isomerase n=1 Tax=Bremerella sp. JC770 TaxID=3232137 RepID=UPI0034574F87
MSSKPWIGSPTFILVMICLIVLPEAANQWSLSNDLESSMGPYLPEETLIHPATGAMVVASVNDVPIYDVEIERYLQRLNVFDDLPETSLQVYRSTVMSQLVRRQVILSYLQTTEYRASEQEISLAVSEVKQALAARGQSLDDFLASGQVDQAMLRRNLAWKIVWTRYLESYLTDANLQRYYERNYERFDGTCRRVSQVYFGEPGNKDKFDWDVAFREAVFLRDRIQQGQITFEEAVAKHSQAPSADDGGDMGWIRHHGPLDPRIHEAAFARPVGEIVGPIQTKFGIHLMKIHEEKRGETEWEDMVDEIRSAAAAFLFSHVADRHISDSNVYYFGEDEGSEIDPSFVRRFSDEFIAP